MSIEISKTKKLIQRLCTGTSVVVALIVLLYMITFAQNGISSNPEDWSRFGDFFGGTLNALLSIINFIVLTFLTIKIVEIEETRNSKILAESVKPIGVFEFEIGHDELKIELYNAGLGPLFIKELSIVSSNSSYIFKDFKEVIDTLQFEKYRPNFIASRSNESIIRKDQFNTLLHIDLKNDGHINIALQDKRKSLQLIKNEISPFKLRLIYTDMYKNEMETIEDELSELAINCS